MCVSVQVEYADGKIARPETIRDLQRALACDPVTLPDYAGAIPPDAVCCLCPVDLEATAERAGFWLTDPDEWGEATLTQIVR